jgi:hypothetical protein
MTGPSRSSADPRTDSGMRGTPCRPCQRHESALPNHAAPRGGRNVPSRRP